LSLVAIALFNAWVALASGQLQPADSAVVSLPQGEVTHIPSPDGKWDLVFECPRRCSERNLYLEDNATNNRRLVKSYERNLTISWAPDGRHFFVDDASGSDEESCSVYEPTTLKATDVATLLTARDPGVKRFLGSGHSYLSARYWTSSRELLVVLFGHFDESPPVAGFTLRYRVNLDGKISKLSQQSEEHPE
jgi:hypothetical protein